MLRPFRAWLLRRRKMIVSTIAPMQSGNLFERCANAAGWLTGAR